MQVRSEYGGLASALAAHIDRTSDSPRAAGIDAGLDWGSDLARASVDAQAKALTESSAPAIEATIDLLAQLGFAPEPVTDDAAAPSASEPPAPDVPEPLAASSVLPTPQAASSGAGCSLRLTRCPLLEAAHEHPEIVCGVHLGLVRGALEVFGEPETETEIEPFSEPGACRLHMGAQAR